MYKYYDKHCLSFFTFHSNFEKYAKEIREEGILGGLSCIMARHVICNDESEKYIQQVHKAECGEIYRKIIGFD